MAISEEELQQKREELASLRDQVQDTEAGRIAAAAAASRQLESDKIDAEMTRLHGELNAAKVAAQIQQDAGSSIDAAKAAMNEAAVTSSNQDNQANKPVQDNTVPVNNEGPKTPADNEGGTE